MSDRIREEMERPEFWHCESAVPFRPPRAKTPVFGDARLASAADLAGLLSPPHDPGAELLHVAPLVSNRDGSLRLLPKERLHLDRELMLRNLLAVGQTEQDRLVLPIVLGILRARPDATVVAFETGGKLFNTIAAWADREHPDLDVRCLNFGRPSRSQGFNPFDNLNGHDPLHWSQAIVQAAEPAGSKGSFWADVATRIACALSYANLRAYGRSCPALVHEQLEQPIGVLLSFLAPHVDLPVVASISEFLGHHNQNSEMALAEARSRFEAWRDPALAAVTSHSDLVLPELTRWPTALVVEVDQAPLRGTWPMISAFMTQLQQSLLRDVEKSEEGQLPRPFFIVIDDLSAVGPIANLPRVLRAGRSHNVGVIAAVESLAQLRGLYGADTGEVLAAFGSKVFLGAVTAADADYASALCGTMTAAVPNIVEADGREGTAFGSPEPLAACHRALLVPEEIFCGARHPLLDSVATFLLSGVPPFQGFLRMGSDVPGIAEVIATAAKRPPRGSLRARALEAELPEAWLEFVQRRCGAAPTSPAITPVTTEAPKTAAESPRRGRVASAARWVRGMVRSLF